MTSASSTSEIISLDTEGIWWLDVECSYFGANIVIGQRLYIDMFGGTAVISDDITNIPFGWALQEVTDGQTELIAVKVHSSEWLWWVLWFFWQEP